MPAGQDRIGDATPPWGVLALEWMEWPLMLAMAWWALPWAGAHLRRHAHAPAHPDLAVPDPIEEEGEHALFA